MPNTKTARLALVAFIGMALSLPGVGNAVTLTSGTYDLHNHPDGNAAPPSYGLRLDELKNLTSNADIFTFDFDHVGAGMKMDLNVGAGTAHIYGKVYGGWDTGTGYNSTLQGLWEVDFNYSGIAGVPSDDDLWRAGVANATLGNTGYIKSLFTDSNAGHGITTGYTQSLVDYTGSNPYSFRFGDEDNDLGHRGFSGISGWGWLGLGTPQNFAHKDSQDWLFTATKSTVPPGNVPEPKSLVLLGAGLLGLVALRRKA